MSLYRKNITFIFNVLEDPAVQMFFLLGKLNMCAEFLRNREAVIDRFGYWILDGQPQIIVDKLLILRSGALVLLGTVDRLW